LMLPSTEAMLNSFREVEIEILVVGRRKWIWKSQKN
jgi:hypothetical protein